jgi:hypothetical protein
MTDQLEDGVGGRILNALVCNPGSLESVSTFYTSHEYE